MMWLLRNHDCRLTAIPQESLFVFRRTLPINTESNDEKRAAHYQVSLETACRCAKIADEYRGREVVVLDLTGVTPIVDFFVIATGTSRRQMHAIAEEINRELKREGNPPLGREGYEESTWILQDYGDVVLHVFTDEARAMYDLEGLWADAKRIDWQTGTPATESPASEPAPTDSE